MEITFVAGKVGEGKEGDDEDEWEDHDNECDGRPANLVSGTSDLGMFVGNADGDLVAPRRVSVGGFVVIVEIVISSNCESLRSWLPIRGHSNMVF